MLLISAHKDVVMHPFRFEYKNGQFKGLLDNSIGMLVCNALLLEEPNIVSIEKKGNISYFFGSGEEWALSEDFPELTKEHTVIVVDVSSGKKYDDYDFAIENISGFSKEEIKMIKGHLMWEGFSPLVKEFTGDSDDEDEAWQWMKLGYKVFSFIIPIQNGSPKTGWHVDDCTVSIEVVNKAKHALKRIINLLC